MNGVEILSTKQVAIAWEYNWNAFWIAFGIIFFIAVLVGIIQSIDSGDCSYLIGAATATTRMLKLLAETNSGTGNYMK